MLKHHSIVALSILGFGLFSAACSSEVEAIYGTWTVREVADENYPDSDSGLLCDYNQSGTLYIGDEGDGEMTLRYTTTCTEDTQTEWVYEWDVRMEETEDVDRYTLVLDGDDSDEDLDCELNDVLSTLDCEDADGNDWTFER